MPYKDPEVSKAKAQERAKRYYEKLKADPERYALSLQRANERSRKVKEWLRQYKLERGCIDCGYNKHWAALDFDHMNGKTINVANAKSIAQAMAEIERHECVVRCANCHRIKSYNTRSWVVEVEKEEVKENV